MDILSLLGNPAVQIATGLLSGGLFILIYNHLKLGQMFKAQGKELGNKLGLAFYHNVVKKIKDDKLREKFIKDLDLAGDQFDDGFDQGIRGIKLK